MTPNSKVALVLGAQGGIGNEVTRALLRHGWLVRALARNPKKTDLAHPRLEWARGDAMRRQDVIDAAYGTSVIVHAVNPAKYHNWRGLALPMLDNTIAAAAMFQATVLLPGTIYNYSDTSPVLDEDTSQVPRTRKGAVRVEMEERLRDVCWDGRVRALIVRAGDFFGAGGNSSWFSQGVVQRGQPVRWVFNPGTAEQMHSWAYLPDIAETMVRLLEQRRSLPAFDTYHFKGHWLRNSDLMDAVCQLAGISRRRVLPFPWWAIHAGAPFVELFDEMREMQYLWKTPIELNNKKLLARIDVEPHTPLDQALRATLVGIGCIRDAHVVPTQTDLTR